MLPRPIAFLFAATFLLAAGCVTVASLRGMVGAVVGAQVGGLAGVDELDRRCQAASHEEPERMACVRARERARGAFKAQLDAVNAAVSK